MTPSKYVSYGTLVAADAHQRRLEPPILALRLVLPGGEPSIAHMLPPTGGDLRTRLADNFSLTPAEARVLEHLASGATVAETAQELGISLNTAKTHLARIFSKTGARQANRCPWGLLNGPR